MSRYVFGVDVGGTFTDVFVWDEAAGSVLTAKVPSTREDLAIDRGVQIAEAVRELDLFIVHEDGAVRVPALLAHMLWEMTLVDR